MQNPRPWWLYTLYIPTLCGCLLLLAPGAFYFPFGNSRDPNWHITLHHAFAHSWVFGRDIVFTYGPLGFLSRAQPYPGNIGYLQAFTGLSYLLILFALCYGILKLRTIGQLCGVLLICYCCSVAEAWLDASVIYLFLSFFFLAVFSQNTRIPWGSLSFFCALISFYLKASTGLLAFLLTYAIHCALLLRANSRRQTLISLGSGTLLLIAFTLVLPVSFFSYCLYSFEFIVGYGEAMHYPNLNSPHLFAIALSLLGFFALCALASLPLFVRSPLQSIPVLLSAFFLFFLFKQGFVRADGHMYEFMRHAPLAIAVYFVAVDDTVRSRFTLFAIATLLFAFSSYENSYQPLQSLSHIQAKLRTAKEIITASEVETLPQAQPPLPALPQSFLTRIGQATVDIFPYQSNQIIRSKLNYRPRPVFQTYAAYTKKLDALNAAFYRGAQAPEYVVFGYERLDNRYPFFDEAQTKRELQSRYQVADFAGGYILLQRQSQDKEMRLLSLETVSAKHAEWLDVPEAAGQVYLSAKLEKNSIGSLLSLFYKAPPWYIELQLSDGRIARVRAIPQQLEAGVMLSPTVFSIAEAKQFFENTSDSLARTKRIRFENSWPFAVEQAIEVSFQELVLR